VVAFDFGMFVFDLRILFALAWYVYCCDFANIM